MKSKLIWWNNYHMPILYVRWELHLSINTQVMWNYFIKEGCTSLVMAKQRGTILRRKDHLSFKYGTLNLLNILFFKREFIFLHGEDFFILIFNFFGVLVRSCFKLLFLLRLRSLYALRICCTLLVSPVVWELSLLCLQYIYIPSIIFYNT